MMDDYKYLDTMPRFEVNGKPALTQIEREKVGDYVILVVRDPLCGYGKDAAEEVAAAMNDAELTARTGMFTTYTGTYRGARISVCSTGSGSPELELALLEFMMWSNADTFIRIGGSGAWSEDVSVGDLVISAGAVRDEGMTKWYVNANYPAVASYEVVVAMVQAAKMSGHRFHVGITRSGDSEFCGWGRPAYNGYLQEEHKRIIDYWNRAGVLNTDRETAAVLTLSSLFGKRGGSICSIGDNVITGQKFQAGAGHHQAIKVGLDAIGILHEMDAAKRKIGTRYWSPTVD